MEEKSVYELVIELLGYPGKMLSGSKTADPERKVIWNANVIVQGKKGRTWGMFPPPIKVWHGDLSLVESEEALLKLASEMYANVYVLREYDGRFDNEKTPKLNRAVAVVSMGKMEIKV